jgi:hypothetical protein
MYSSYGALDYHLNPKNDLINKLDFKFGCRVPLRQPNSDFFKQSPPILIQVINCHCLILSTGSITATVSFNPKLIVG